MSSSFKIKKIAKLDQLLPSTIANRWYAFVLTLREGTRANTSSTVSGQMFPIWHIYCKNNNNNNNKIRKFAYHVFGCTPEHNQFKYIGWLSILYYMCGNSNRKNNAVFPKVRPNQYLGQALRMTQEKETILHHISFLISMLHQFCRQMDNQLFFQNIQTTCDGR